MKEPSIGVPLAPADLMSRIATFVRFMSGGSLTDGDIQLLRTVHVPGEPVDIDAVLAAPRTAGRWGWKEPNTQLFLDPLIDAIDGLRYVHVTRHGLDMAFSSNVNQLRNFGARFGLTLPADPDEVPVVQLDYWIASTRAALETVSASPSWSVPRFVVRPPVRRPRHRAHPTARVLGGRAHPRARLGVMAAMVEAPPSMGRYRTEDLSRFRPDQLSAVEALGFAITS